MDYNLVTFDDIINNFEFNIYLEKGNELLGTMGFTDHSAAHTMKVAITAARILTELGYSEREIELAKIAGYIHDIGNMINRVNHAQTGALMAFNILTKMNMNPEEIATVVAAVGNHDEHTGRPVSPVSAAVIIADKTDVRRSRVRNKDEETFDIHDRVNYAVEKAELLIFKTQKENVIRLVMQIDKEISPVFDYFEIFMERMMLSRKAAEYLNASFQFNINDAKLL